jgi:hypothetical protein
MLLFRTFGVSKSMRRAGWILLLVVALASVGFAQRRRSVRPPGQCARPSLTITISKSSVCPGEQFTVSWTASDVKATVSIDGVGSPLPWSGSAVVSTNFSTAYTGRATNACGTGAEASAPVSVRQGSTALLGSSASSLQQGQTATLTVTVADVSGWSLSSALGNGLSVTSGTSSRTVTYIATYAGTDTITLLTTGCGSMQRTTTIVVNGMSSPPPPPPPSGNLRCCDGTISPTCTSCANKRGCCSNHGGVCGCPP